MLWSKRCRLTRPAVRRRGSFLFEAIAALALLAAAATAVASLAGSLSREHRSQMERLAVRFAAENLIERLRAADYEELPQVAERLRTAAPESAADHPAADEVFEVKIRLQPFIASGIDGQHVVVTVTGGQQDSGRPLTAEQELWRFEDAGRTAATGRGPGEQAAQRVELED